MSDISKVWTISINNVGKMFTTPKSSIGKVMGSNFVSGPPAGGDVGIYGGGTTNGADYVNVLEYRNISSTGNPSDFGDLVYGQQRFGALSNAGYNRGVFGGGDRSGSTPTSYMGYITINTPGNASTFGNLSVSRNLIAGTSNATNGRGVFGGGYSFAYHNEIDYITINTTGNATDFGDLRIRRYGVGACSNGTTNRGVFAGGYGSEGRYNEIDYITITSTGNASDFGDLRDRDYYSCGLSNGASNRGVFGLFNERAELDYITINTTGNASNFGNLGTVQRRTGGGCSNNTRGILAGGYRDSNSSFVYNIDYITIATTGNSANYGNLSASKGYLAATSNA